MKLIALLVGLSVSSAWAATDVVRVIVRSSSQVLSFEIDHPVQIESLAGGQRFAVSAKCAGTGSVPVVVANETTEELFLVSSTGIARLSPPQDFGAHTATFRSLPNDRYDLAVMNPFYERAVAGAFKIVCSK